MPIEKAAPVAQLTALKDNEELSMMPTISSRVKISIDTISTDIL
jgi:hypothetical protein